MKMKKVLFYCLFALFLGGFLFGGYQIYSKLREREESAEAYTDIADLVVQTVPTATESPTESEPAESQGAQTQTGISKPHDPTLEGEKPPASTEPIKYHIPVPISVDFAKLQEINPDIIGWIYCEDTPINYPVLQGETNKTYLRHQYDGEYNYAGSIFMDHRNDPELADPYTMIFGHNMTNGTMFHIFESFRRQKFMEEHSDIFYLTPSGQNYCFRVICSNLTQYKDELRLFELRDETRRLDLIRSKASADTGIEVSPEDQLVLLATCAYDYKNARITLLTKVLPLA